MIAPLPQLGVAKRNACWCQLVRPANDCKCLLGGFLRGLRWVVLMSFTIAATARGHPPRTGGKRSRTGWVWWESKLLGVSLLPAAQLCRSNTGERESAYWAPRSVVIISQRSASQTDETNLAMQVTLVGMTRVHGDPVVVSQSDAHPSHERSLLLLPISKEHNSKQQARE